MVTRGGSRKAAGDEGEALALAFLERHGMRLVRRNYRVAGGPHARGGEVDLIVRDRDGSLVFVEVRRRGNTRHGGAAASVDATKQRRLALAARHFLLAHDVDAPCRFDVIAIDGINIEWLKAAFDGD